MQGRLSKSKSRIECKRCSEDHGNDDFDATTVYSKGYGVKNPTF